MEKIRLTLLDLVKRKDFWIRVLFLVIAFFFWFLMKLSKTGYSSSLSYPVMYENIPESKILSDNPTQQIQLQISSHGFRLLGYEIRNKEPLRIDVKRQVKKLNDDRYYWLPNLYREELQAQLDPQTSLMRIQPDTVYVSLSEQTRKQVPVVADIQVQCAPGFETDGDAEIKPLMVTVLGAKAELDSLNYILTEHVTFNQADQSILTQLDLRSPGESFTIKPISVEYKQKIDEFTERQLEVPIRITNVPDGYTAEIIPGFATISCKLALERVPDLEETDFDVICNFDQLNAYPNRKRLILDVVNDGPGQINAISHKSVDFILLKK